VSRKIQRRKLPGRTGPLPPQVDGENYFFFAAFFAAFFATFLTAAFFLAAMNLTSDPIALGW